MPPLLLLACAAPGASPPPGPPALSDVERVVVIGDGAATSPSPARSWPSLLAHNDDDLFPEWAGLDLATVAPAVEIVTLSTAGEHWRRLAAGESIVCACDAGCGRPCLDTADPRPTALVFELGTYDLMDAAVELLISEELRVDPTPLIAAWQADVPAVVGAVRAQLAAEPAVVLLTLPDPSDGVGDLAALVTTLFPVEGADRITPALALQVIDGLDGAIRGAAPDATLVDVRAAFLGHGYHYDDPAAPAWAEADPTLWYRDVLTPNARGAHELRRLMWRALRGEEVTALPTELPPEALAGLPEVSSWAAAVGPSNIAEVFGPAALPNLAPDPEAALGPPEGVASGTVAVGPTGAWLVVDMGATVPDVEGPDLVVLEFGVLSGGTPEPYRVSVSAADDGPWTSIGDGLGEQAFDLAGAKGARWVRVDSLAPEAEILAGAGSPYYPGPEIDAIGRVAP